MSFLRRSEMAALWIILGVASAAGQGYIVRFEQSEYVAQMGEPLPIRVLFSETPASGLFSYGVLLSFDPVLTPVTGAGAIWVPAALDFNGVEGAGAFREIGNGFAGVKGTVNFFSSPIGYYGDPWLATFTVQFPTPGEYALGLDLFRTLGPTEAIFVSGTGMVLDSQIGFGSTLVQVIPEPGVGLLMAAGLAGFALMRRGGVGRSRKR